MASTSSGAFPSSSVRYDEDSRSPAFPDEDPRDPPPLCETECGLNRLEMFKRPLRFLELDRHILFRPLQLVIPVKVVLCILRGRECRIERNPDLFICIVILTIKMILAAFQRIPIGMQKLAIYAIFVLPLCAFQLLFLEHQLL